MPANMPFDYASQNADIEQRKALAQSLLQSGLTPRQGQMVGRRYISPGIGGLLESLAKVMVGRNMQGEASVQGSELQGKYRSALSEGLSKFMDTSNGKPGETLSDGQAANLMENGNAPQLREPQEADPRRAAIEAMGSGLPPLQNIGQSQLAALLKPKDPEKFGHTPTTVTDANGKLASVLVGDQGTAKPLAGYTPYERPMAVEGRVVSPSAPNKPLADYSVKGGEQKTVNGDLYQVDSNGRWHKLDNAPKIAVDARSNTFIKGQKAGMEEWSKLVAKTVGETAESARSSVKLLGTLNQLEASDKAGVISGPLTTPAQFLTGLGQSLGIPVDSNKLANSQTFDAASISAWQDMIKAAGGNRGVVKEEASRIAQMVPQLSQSPQGRKQLTAFLRQAAQQNIADAKRMQVEYSKALQAENPGLFTFGLSEAEIPRQEALPVAPGAVSNNKPSSPIFKGW